jgi:hypothetical protein
MLKILCKKFGCKENYKIAKIYNKSGLQLFNDDIMLLGGGDILYLAIKGMPSLVYHVDLCRRGF